MNKLFAALLVPAALVACGGKRESTTPVSKDKASMEHKDDAAGGAAYGGKSAGGAKDAASPDAPK